MVSFTLPAAFRPVNLETAAASQGREAEVRHPADRWVSHAGVYRGGALEDLALPFNNAPMTRAVLSDVLLVDGQYPVVEDLLVFQAMSHNAETQLTEMLESDGSVTTHFQKRTRGFEEAQLRRGLHFLVGGRSNNFWHVLYNFVLRLGYIESDPDEELRARAGLVIHADLRESLRPVFTTLGFDEHRLVPVSRFAAERFETLVVGELPFFFHGNRPHAAQTAARFVRARLPTPSRRDRRLYISRRDARHRRVLNEAEVVQALAPHGFEVIELSGLDIPQIVQIMGEAEIVVGPSGANLAATLFCQPETKVLELTYQHYLQKYYFQGGSSLGGLDHYKLEGSAVETGEHYSLWDFSVPTAELSPLLSRLLAP